MYSRIYSVNEKRDFDMYVKFAYLIKNKVTD